MCASAAVGANRGRQRNSEGVGGRQPALGGCSLLDSGLPRWAAVSVGRATLELCLLLVLVVCILAGPGEGVGEDKAVGHEVDQRLAAASVNVLRGGRGAATRGVAGPGGRGRNLAAAACVGSQQVQDAARRSNAAVLSIYCSSGRLCAQGWNRVAGAAVARPGGGPARPARPAGVRTWTL